MCICEQGCSASTVVQHSLSVLLESEDLYVHDISSYEISTITDTSTDDSYTSSPTSSSSQSPVPITPPVVRTEATSISTPRHSTRVSRSPIWMSDYVVPQQKQTSCSYHIFDSINYLLLQPSYSKCLAAYSAEVEPRNFTEAAQDPKWVVTI